MSSSVKDLKTPQRQRPMAIAAIVNAIDSMMGGAPPDALGTIAALVIGTGATECKRTGGKVCRKADAVLDLGA